MNISNIPFSELPMLAKMDRAYSELNPSLRPFYKYEPTLESFQDVINDKSKENINREVLVSTLKKQYKAFDTEGVASPQPQIEKLLNKNTFTVVTAHQPSLLTGPLYFIYKICSIINLSERLNEHYKENQFVPVFVIGGEDHDFEEVNFINIFNKKLTWNRSDTEGGAVGMMSTESLKPILEELKTILGTSEKAEEIYSIIEKSYTQNALYQDATQDLLHQLFGQYGLVVLNMNDANLKRLFIPIMKREITEQPSKSLVEKTQQELDSLGFKSQAFPREINLFYLRENLRERIVFENGIYRVLNTDFQWQSQADILKELEETPQYFSPNVVLRPLYQEVILPNLAYIGGGGELAYWLERKTQFALFGVNFPMLVRRNSVLWIDKGSNERISKLGLQIIDLVQDTDILLKQYVNKITATPLSMTIEKSEIERIFEGIVSKAVAIDPTLEKSMLAEKTKQLQAIEMIESKLLKTEKQKNETTLNQVKALAQKFFPNGGLQERVDNFLPFYLKYGRDFIDILIKNLYPLEQGLIVISE